MSGRPGVCLLGVYATRSIPADRPLSRDEDQSADMSNPGLVCVSTKVRDKLLAATQSTNDMVKISCRR
jgi:hypothetical protein